MISRRNFLKLIGVVPVVLTMPSPPVIAEAVSRTVTFPPPPMPMTNQDEWYSYSGTSSISELPDGHFKWVG